MILSNANRIILDGREAVRATLNGQVVWQPGDTPPLPDTQYFVDFSQYATNSTPADWTRYGGSATFVVRDDGAPATEGKYLAVQGDGSYSDFMIAYNALNSDSRRANVECLMKFSANSASPEVGPDIGVVARATSGAGQLYLATFEPYTTGGNFNIYYVNNWSFSQIGDYASPSFNFVADTLYWMRVRFDGSNIRIRCWPASGSEPAAWGIERSDTRLTAAGMVGIAGHTGVITRISQISFATDGDTAPASASG